MYAKGFSVIEALVALSIVTILTVTVFGYESFSRKMFDRLKNTKLVSPTTYPSTCFVDEHYAVSNIEYIPIPFVTGALYISGYIFVTTDSNVIKDPDFYVLKNSSIIYSTSTGPGLRDIDIAHGLVYVANTASSSQLQVIDFKNHTLLKTYKNGGVGNVVYAYNNKIYLGTEKWSGPELAILDLNMNLVYAYETNSQVNDILFSNNILYVAASDKNQLHIIATTTTTFSPSGWETQEGKVLAASGTSIYFGRTVGGFNNINNHELFLLGATSTDLGVGVYGLVSVQSLLFVLTPNNLQIWKKPLSHVTDIPLTGVPVSLSCSNDKIIIGLKDGVAIITFDYVN